MNELALFAGAGGGILGGLLHGWRTVAAVEIEDYPRRVLLQRQADGILPRFPIWDDVCTFDGTEWRGMVDVVSGGFPCQDISCAGKGAGLAGARSGLWGEMARIICEVGPRFVFVENSPMLTSRGLGVVLGDLATMGYDARWGVLGACDAGAPHKRDRIWILAYAGGELGTYQCVESQDCRNSTIGGNYEEEWGQYRQFSKMGTETLCGLGLEWKEGTRQPPACGIVNGVANQVDRLKAIGNGQVPAVAALAWEVLGGPIE